ncbi:MAG TPA: TSUP family transporter [Alkalispirochaeta sp.]|nr:TSUP family transporter [Alkalispirochaeta sp.]
MSGELDLGILQLGLLVIAGVVGGFINTLAGGGSLLTIPALLFLGVPAQIANGTNRVGILLQTAVSSWRFHKRGAIDSRHAVGVLIPGLIGAILGALIAVELPPEVFDYALGMVLILVLVTLFIPRSFLEKVSTRAMPGWLRTVLFFAIGVYGGFIQAGVGFLLISGIVVTLGLDLVKTNALKVLLIFFQTIVALIIFSLYGSVIWIAGLLLAVGTTTGAWLGVHFAVTRGAKAVRWIVVIAAVVSAFRLFGVI